MMRGTDRQQATMFSYLSPERRVPADHPLRTLRPMVDDALATTGPMRASFTTSGRPVPSVVISVTSAAEVDIEAAQATSRREGATSTVIIVTRLLWKEVLQVRKILENPHELFRLQLFHGVERQRNQPGTLGTPEKLALRPVRQRVDMALERFEVASLTRFDRLLQNIRGDFPFVR